MSKFRKDLGKLKLVQKLYLSQNEDFTKSVTQRN